MSGFNELNSEIHQYNVPVESGQTYRLQCDYHISFKLPSEVGTPYVFVLKTVEVGDVLTVELSGIGDELVVLDAIGSGGTFIANGSTVTVQAHVYGFHLGVEGYEYMLIDITNISLKRVV